MQIAQSICANDEIHGLSRDLSPLIHWYVNTFQDTFTAVFSCIFKFYRWQVAIVRMKAMSVVENFDGVDEGFSGRE